ncbi:MAG: bifunctional DNA-formamidopyrimidine glycosylase/DNA-(apurinic or apyrimidinic site) lyase [Anaerolineae bacterium]|nr:bifunctional DNA-formamidopyrimidine glycosylase/DNA-(apurinic or apyrimidinic site) lyase [Anaerolineae bacterium]
MPELPEVENVVRGLREPLVGRVAGALWYDWAKTIRTPDPDSFAARIAGQTFRAVERRAKYILCRMDHDTLVVHLKMTGRLYVTDAGLAHPDDRWAHFRLGLDGGRELRFSDARKFGFVALVASLDELEVDLGPEPLEGGFTQAYMRDRLSKTGRGIKALLLDQAFVAGVGNIYADEALWRARIHPMTPANALSTAAVKRLHSAVRAALADGVEFEGASINWYRKPDGSQGEAQNHFSAYDRTGEPCPRCGAAIEKIRAAGRGTHYCPRCQRL